MATPTSLRQPNGNPRRPLTVEVNNSYGSHESSGPTPEPSPEGPPKATEYFVDQHSSLLDDAAGADRTDELFGSDLMMLDLQPAQEMGRSNQHHGGGILTHPMVHGRRRAPSPYSPPPESLIALDEDEKEVLGVATATEQSPRDLEHRQQQQQHRAPSSRGHSHRNRPPLQEVSVEGSHRSAGSTRNGGGTRGGDVLHAPLPPPIGNSFSFEADLQQQLRHLAALQVQQQHPRSMASPGSTSMHTAAQQYTSPAASTSHQYQQQHIHRSQLLPAVVQLKRELLEAHQSAFLLKRENEASNAKHLETHAQLQSSIDQLQEELGALRQSNSDLVRQHAEATDEAKAADTRARAVEEAKRELEVQLQAAVAERDELEAAVLDREQKVESVTAANRDLSDSIASLEHQVQNLSDERRGLVEEVQHLRENLERDKAADTSMIQSLKNDKDALQNELSATRGALDRADKELTESRDRTQSLQDELREARRKLKHVVAESTQRESELQERIQLTQLAERQGRESSQIEIERLRACLKDAELNLARQEQGATSEKDQLKADIVAWENKHKLSARECAALRRDILVLRKELSVKSQELQQLENIPTTEASCQTDAPPALQEFGTQTENEEHSSILPLFAAGGYGYFGDVESMVDRVGRARDASERASLTQAHRNQVKRIQLEHAAELRKAEESYNARLSSVLHDAESEAQRQKLKLKAEWESKLASMETRHRRELDQARFEYEASIAEANVTVNAAEAELTLTQQALELETSRRVQLEQETSSLKAQVDIHKQREREVTLRKDRETKSLLSSIRDDCNMAFDKRGVRVLPSTLQNLPAIGSTVTLTATSSSSKSTSPRSVVFSEPSSSPPQQQPFTPGHDRIVPATPRAHFQMENSTPKSAGPPASSPGGWVPTNQTLKNVDLALDETEQLIRSLLG